MSENIHLLVFMEKNCFLSWEFQSFKKVPNFQKVTNLNNVQKISILSKQVHLY